MTNLYYTSEAGANGSPVAPGAGSGNDWDSNNVGTAATNNWSNAHAAHGKLGITVATAGTVATAYNAWTSTSFGSPTTVWGRANMYFTANPTVAANFGRGLNGGVQKYRLVVSTGGKLQLNNAANGNTVTFTNSIPLNQEFRAEWRVDGSATGTWLLALYSNMDDAAALESQTGTDNFTAGAFDEVRYGIGSGLASIVAYFMDDCALSTTGPLGPAAPLRTAPYTTLQAVKRAALY